jgi:hypothetical protein
MLVWETDPSLRENEPGAAFADVWCAIPKVVFSHTLESVQGNARLAEASLAEEAAGPRCSQLTAARLPRLIESAARAPPDQQDTPRACRRESRRGGVAAPQSRDDGGVVAVDEGDADRR